MFFSIGLMLLFCSVLGFGVITRHYPKNFADSNAAQRAVVLFFSILMLSGLGCFLYSLFMLVVRLFDYIWVTLP